MSQCNILQYRNIYPLNQAMIGYEKSMKILRAFLSFKKELSVVMWNNKEENGKWTLELDMRGVIELRFCELYKLL